MLSRKALEARSEKMATKMKKGVPGPPVGVRNVPRTQEVSTKKPMVEHELVGLPKGLLDETVSTIKVANIILP